MKSITKLYILSWNCSLFCYTLICKYPSTAQTFEYLIYTDHLSEYKILPFPDCNKYVSLLIIWCISSLYLIRHFSRSRIAGYRVCVWPSNSTSCYTHNSKACIWPPKAMNQKFRSVLRLRSSYWKPQKCPSAVDVWYAVYPPSGVLPSNEVNGLQPHTLRMMAPECTAWSHLDQVWNKSVSSKVRQKLPWERGSDENGVWRSFCSVSWRRCCAQFVKILQVLREDMCVFLHVGLLFTHSVVSSLLQPHGPQHARLPRPSLFPGVCSNACPLSQWC